MSASENAKTAEEERTIFAYKPKVRKMETDKDDSHSKRYNKSDGKQVHVDIEEVTEDETALALLLNKS